MAGCSGAGTARLVPVTAAAAEEEAALRCRLYLGEADYRASASRPADAFTGGSTGTRTPDKTHARWLGAKTRREQPIIDFPLTAKRLNAVGGRYRRSLFGKPSVAVSMSPCAAVTIPSSFPDTRFTSAA
jgi:hypothetical protein